MMREYNFDGLIGPTHHYGGLSFGNLASADHQHQPSHPRAAALQGLQKMKLLASLGIGQCVLPPLRRPQTQWLRELGFRGTSQSDVIEAAYQRSPELVAVCFSAASMWAANGATVSPSADCHDGRLQFTPANLSSTLHRALEAPSTTRLLETIFASADEFLVHPPLPCSTGLSDEGAANHTRLCDSLRNWEQSGIEIFVYGSDPFSVTDPSPTKFPARQSRLASESIARRHGLFQEDTFFWQQNPAAIDAGVFHNDVICVGNENVLLCHELAFVDQAKCLKTVQRRFAEKYDSQLQVIEFSSVELPITNAVGSYLFNSQLVTRPEGAMTLICPVECEEIESAKNCVQRVLESDNRVDEVRFVNLRQSMNNGGGPACLRLRVAMTETQAAQFHQGCLLTPSLADQLEIWIKTHYRETLNSDDLRDPLLIDESLTALEALAPILDLPVDLLLDRDG